MPLKPGRLAIGKALGMLAAFAFWCYFLWRALSAFSPGSQINIVAFNSDSAIPVLMSNDQRPLTIFNRYYYAADRWGAWPFLGTRLVAHLTGYRWTDESVFAVQCVWLFVGVVVFGWLSRSDAGVVALVYLIALCLHRESRHLIFELSQIYAWQTTAIILSWYCLRGLFDGYLAATGNAERLKRLIWLVPTLLFSFLAIWSSVASALFLAFVLTLEALRARLRGPGHVGKTLLAVYALGWLTIGAAALLELLQKASYRRFSLRHFGSSYATHFGFDTGHLNANLAAQLQHLDKLSWWPVYAVPTAALLGLACASLFAALWRKDRFLTALRAVLADDTALLAMGAYGLAALNFVLTVVVDHVRLNFYDDRYLILTNLFAPVSGMLTVFVLLKIAVSSRLSPYVRPSFLLAALALLTFQFPARVYSLQYQQLKDTALTLARKAPRGVLMGSYWDTYVFAALQPDDTMIPVPVMGQVDRMPWTRKMVRRADRVVVAYRRRSPGAPVSPPQILRHYGNTLKLIDADWYANHQYAFALYANKSR
jgi:hypothetical protein